MTAPRSATRALTALVVAGLLVGAACRSSDGGAGVTAVAGEPMTTLVSPETAASPAETAAPDTTAAPPDTPVAPAGPGVVVTPSGVVVPVVAEVDGGWRVRTPCGAVRTITEGTHVARTTIVLDPGHGGNERGAISPGGLAEAVVNMAVARVTQAELEANEVSVVLTRTGDYDLGLSVRAQIAKALGPKALVSIHNNADPDERRPVPGTETYY